MRKISIIVVALLLLGLLAFAGGRTEKAGAMKLSGSIKVAGSSTVYPITVAVAEEFNKLYPDVEVAVQSTGTGGGFKNFFMPGKTDINDASRPIKDSEIEECKANGFEPLEFRVGTDAVTIVVSPQATWVDNMTVEELAKIWRPDNPAQTWKDVNPSWPNEKIELYGPTSASGTFEFFTEEVMKKAGASRSDYQGTEQDNTIVQAVAGSKNAMGYFGMAYYLENKDRVKALKVGGVAPSLETAKSGQYKPLSRPLFIYVNSESLKRPEMEAFIRFYLDQIDTSMISQIGYVPMTAAEKQAMVDKFEKALASLK
jgi:phosphate transport system substrate-binding protein